MKLTSYETGFAHGYKDVEMMAGNHATAPGDRKYSPIPEYRRGKDGPEISSFCDRDYAAGYRAGRNYAWDAWANTPKLESFASSQERMQAFGWGTFNAHCARRASQRA